MNKQYVLSEVKTYVSKLFEDDATGHDYYHMKRVATTAKRIAITERADVFIVEVAAWLHDVGDKKLFIDPTAAKRNVHNFMKNMSFTQKQIEHIKMIINEISYSSGHKKPTTIEGQIVQDADRLDALGAIGIARTFAYGGSRQQLIYSTNTSNNSIQHFYDKLLLLNNLMNTESAKLIAKERHQFMESYLNQFFKEWDGELQ